MKSNHNKQTLDYSVIILAGGNSTRMGFPKPWLKIKNGKTFLSSIISEYRLLGIKNILVVLNKKLASEKWLHEIEDVKKNAIIILNNEADKGRLFSLKLGLEQVSTDFTYIHNVDSPFVEREPLERLMTYADKKGVTIPTFQGEGGHPIIINKSIYKDVIDNYDHYPTLKDVLNKYDRKYVPVKSKTILVNINTPNDLETINNELV